MPKIPEDLVTRFIIAAMNVWRDLRDNSRGASGFEYGILVAAIATLIVVVAFSIGGRLSTAFTLDDPLPEPTP